MEGTQEHSPPADGRFGQIPRTVFLWLFLREEVHCLTAIFAVNEKRVFRGAIPTKCISIPNPKNKDTELFACAFVPANPIQPAY
jgi:hypothetical protein